MGKWKRERILRDFFVFMVNITGGFADLLNLGDKHYRLQGQLRPVFKMFALLYILAVAALAFFEYYSVAIVIALLAIQGSVFLKKTCSGSIKAKDSAWMNLTSLLYERKEIE